jgi:hypothetical protein
MKRASALKYGSKSNSVTKYSYNSAYKSWKSVMIIRFRTSTKYIKLTASDTYSTLKGYIYCKSRGLDSSWDYEVKV